MLQSLNKEFKGLVTITGPTKSGKSQFAEFLIKDQDSITYIATSIPRNNDIEWNKRIEVHRNRRPDSWKLIENPADICQCLDLFAERESILIDSLGGLVEKYLNYSDNEWNEFQNKFVTCLREKCYLRIIVTEEVGWGIVPATSVGHLFRERLSTISSIIFNHSTKKWLVIHGTAIDLDQCGFRIT